MLLGTLGASLLGNLLTGRGKSKGILRAGKSKGILRAGEGVLTAGEGVLRAGYGRPLSSALQNKMDF